MKRKNILPVFALLVIVLAVTQWACLLGVVMDANPAGSKYSVEERATAALTATQQELPADASTEAVEATATEAAFDITAGSWRGQSQWLCDNNAPCDTQLKFSRNGRVELTFICAGADAISVESTWEMDGEEIRIDSVTSPWFGVVEGKTMAGEFTESRDGYECSGIWYAEQE